MKREAMEEEQRKSLCAKRTHRSRKLKAAKEKSPKSRGILAGFVLESLEVAEGVEWSGLVEIDVEQGLAEVVVLGGEHL